MKFQNLLSLTVVFALFLFCLCISNLQATTQTEQIANAPPIVQEVISDVGLSADDGNFDLFNIVSNAATYTETSSQAAGQFIITDQHNQSPAATKKDCLSPGVGIVKALTVSIITRQKANELFENGLKQSYRSIETMNRSLSSGSVLAFVLLL